METKTCTKCKIEKALTQFQVRKMSKDGLTARCKSCLSEYDRDRFKNDPRVKQRHERYLKTKGGKDAARRAKHRYIERNAIKRGVHVMTGNAIRDGKLTKKPCEICCCVDVHAHHDDYSKPLDVRWLCPLHHKQWHDENGEGLNG